MAQIRLRIAPAKAASITPVRPEEAGPTTSLRAPRSSPPVRVCQAQAPPVDTVKGDWRSEAGGRLSPLAGEDSIRAAKRVCSTRA